MQIWEKVKGVLTPGGEPCYRCPKCGFEHLHGIENQNFYNRCPNCNSIIIYPWQEKDVTVKMYRDENDNYIEEVNIWYPAPQHDDKMVDIYLECE